MTLKLSKLCISIFHNIIISLNQVNSSNGSPYLKTIFFKAIKCFSIILILILIKKMKCLNEINDNNEKTYSRFGY